MSASQRLPAGDAIAHAEACINHSFADRALLLEALTHTSLGPGDREREPFGYQRLEFLGDRVLGLIVAELLLDRFPHEGEGPIAKRHAALVQRATLADVATEIDLAAAIQMSRGEEQAGGRANPSLLADVAEAVIGALYLDAGLEAARRFVLAHWAPLAERDTGPPQDPKTQLQEWAQARGLGLPVYELADRSGPSHDPLFVIRVSVDGRMAEGRAGAKRMAEKEAASALLDRIGQEDDG